MRNSEMFALSRQQRGYIVESVYLATTGEQFTDESFEYIARSRWALIALLKAYVGVKVAKWRRKKDGARRRKANGWL